MTSGDNAFSRLLEAPEERRNEHLAEWRRTIGGAVPLNELEPRCRCRVAGVIQNIRIDPRAGRGFIEATIIDGSGGHLVIRLLGRSSLAGWRLGEGLVCDGIVASEGNEYLMLNPEYDLVSAPEHG